MNPITDATLDTAGHISRQRPRAERIDPARTGLLALVLLYIIVAYAWRREDFGALLPVYGELLALHMPVAIAILVCLGCPLIAPRRPLGFAIDMMYSRGATAGLVVILFSLSLVAFTTYKINIPNVVPFYSDRMLADIDERLHGGLPWMVAHALLSGWGAILVEIAYSQIWFLLWFRMVFAAALSPRRAALRYLWALALTTLLVGTVLVTLLASVGPIYYDTFIPGSRFEGLISTLQSQPVTQRILDWSGYLLSHYRAGQPSLGTGISAMPSMHVAVAVLNAAYPSSLGHIPGLLGWIFAATILLGSVYTGWHYAIDGYLSVLVVGVIWRLTGFLASPRPDEAPAETSRGRA